MQNSKVEHGQAHSSVIKHPTTSEIPAIAFGISLPQNVLDKIDADRGDVSRSRFLLRMIERVYYHADKGDRRKISSSLNYSNKIQEAIERNV